MRDEERRAHWVEIFSALASEPRLHIVELLAGGNSRCQEILGQLELSQPAVSYHLAKLERAGILHKERQGTRNCYRLREELLEIVRIIAKEDRSWITR